jgi:hypothetical protein
MQCPVLVRAWGHKSVRAARSQAADNSGIASGPAQAAPGRVSPRARAKCTARPATPPLSLPAPAQP